MPSQTPIRAVTSGLRSVDRRSSSVGTRSSRPAGRGHGTQPFGLEDAEPAAGDDAAEQAGQHEGETGGAGQRCQSLGAEQQPRGRQRLRRPSHFEADLHGAQRRPRRVDRRRRRGRPGATRSRTRRSSRAGSPPMPMLPSASRRRTPGALSRGAGRTRRGAARVRRAPGSSRTASGTRSTPRTGTPRSEQVLAPSGRVRSRCRACGPVQWARQRRSACVDGAAPRTGPAARAAAARIPCTVHGASRSAAGVDPAAKRAAGHSAGRGMVTAGLAGDLGDPPAPGEPGSGSRPLRHGLGVGRPSSTSRIGAAWATAAPAATPQGGAGARRRSGGGHLDAAAGLRRRCPAGTRPSTHQPPSTGRTEHGVRGPGRHRRRPPRRSAVGRPAACPCRPGRPAPSPAPRRPGGRSPAGHRTRRRAGAGPIQPRVRCRPGSCPVGAVGAVGPSAPSARSASSAR